MKTLILGTTILLSSVFSPNARADGSLGETLQASTAIFAGGVGGAGVLGILEREVKVVKAKGRLASSQALLGQTKHTLGRTDLSGATRVEFRNQAKMLEEGNNWEKAFIKNMRGQHKLALGISVPALALSGYLFNDLANGAKIDSRQYRMKRVPASYTTFEDHSTSLRAE